MNHIHKKRLWQVSFFMMVLGVVSALILFALKQNINVFVTPSQLQEVKVNNDFHLRLGGLVKKGSILHDKKNLAVSFIVTDFKRDIKVNFNGVLPDLFREGKGIVAEGYLNDKREFIATQVLAKHDENYMPKNVYDEMRKNSKVT